MKIRTSPFGVLVLAVGLLCIFTAGSAIAQGFAPPPAQGFLPPPYSPTQMQPMPFAPTQHYSCWGMFYVAAGASWRRVQADFETNSRGLLLAATGVTVPFGPTTGGNVNYPAIPSGNLADPPNLSGLWVYADGLIDPYSPGLTAQDRNWTSAIGGLGHDTVDITNPTPPPDTITVPRNTGVFVLIDPTTQTSNAGGFYNQTTSVTFSLDNVGGTSITAHDGPKYFTSVDSERWAPYIEFGTQSSNFFEVFVAFTGFSVGKSYGKVVPLDLVLSTLRVVDTYPFQSDNTTEAWVQNWGGLSSTIGGAGEPAEGSYLILPSSGTRQFISTPVVTLPEGTLQDTVTSRLDATVLESRVGGRSWVPLYGLGKLNYGLGGLFAWIPYRISNSSRLTNPADILDETGAVIVPANTEIRRTENLQEDRWFNFGMFTSLGLELGPGRWLVRGDLVYDWYWLTPHYVDVVKTGINATGWGFDVAGGLRF